MTDTATLEFILRENLDKAEKKKLMKNGYLIGNINSKGNPSIAIALKRDAFRKTLKTYGRNAVLKLVDQKQKNYNVMIKSIQVDPKDYSYHHVDFQQVDLTEKVKAQVALKYTGLELLESKRLVVNRLVDTILVSGLPQDIPDSIEFDVSNLKAGDNIFVSDLQLIEGIKPELDQQLLVGSIIESKNKGAEEEVAATEEENN